MPANSRWDLIRGLKGKLGATAPQWARASSFVRFLDQTQRRTAGGMTPLDEWSARRRDLYMTTHNTHNRKTSMSLVGFEPTSRLASGCQVAYATWQRPTTARPTTFHVCKTRACLCSFRLPMMGGVSPETCWASFKTRNNKILIHCCILLGFFSVIITLWCTDPRSSNRSNVLDLMQPPVLQEVSWLQA